MATYYRTGAGDHRHSQRSCAFVHKRSVMVGEVSEIPATEVDAFPPCTVCCSGEVEAHAAATQAARVAAGRCELKSAIPGSYNPRLVSPRGDCRCGARSVSMVRKTMSLRAHTMPA